MPEPNGGPANERALAAFVKAMETSSRVAICRFVPKDGANVRLVYLFPRALFGSCRGVTSADKENGHPCMAMMDGPFREDLRHHEAAGMDPSKLSQEQREAARALVQELALPLSPEYVWMFGACSHLLGRGGR